MEKTYMKVSQIPYDLEDLLDTAIFDEIRIDNSLLDRCLLYHGIVEHGYASRNARRLSSKGQKMTYEEVECAITGLTEEQIRDQRVDNARKSKIRKFHELAGELGYDSVRRQVVDDHPEVFI